MTFTQSDIQEKKEGIKLYDYQHDAIEQIFERLDKYPKKHNLLYQLPTGGGKTVIFSKIAKRYIEETKKKVLILTHRIELSKQTSDMLAEFGVENKIINSKVKKIDVKDEHMCYVAMVETLNNRLQEDKVGLKNVGLIIIDEAHYNSFNKLFKFFEDRVMLGVTATPLSSSNKFPMRDTYDELIVGHSITELIEKGFLSQATTFNYDVNLNSLTIGINGDYTVSSSERLYTNDEMLDIILRAYNERSKGKKVLVFNNGIKTSQEVCRVFTQAGLEVKHLDNKNTEAERQEILTWFKETPQAILTSVGILTTGFDEPTIDTIILNRATKSLTLYHQMIGRGSRITKTKGDFTVIDLGNNMLRFGQWEEHVDWDQIFRAPDAYLESIVSDAELQKQFKYIMPDHVKEQFSKTKKMDFDIKLEYENALSKGKRPMFA
ncbi:MAG: DEAD/DEAH box helicase, partial [Bacteroidia bacterium]|nr:DEAD/DEAH box helicase [Bacteroidia bacterium]